MLGASAEPLFHARRGSRARIILALSVQLCMSCFVCGGPTTLMASRPVRHWTGTLSRSRMYDTTLIIFDFSSVTVTSFFKQGSGRPARRWFIIFFDISIGRSEVSLSFCVTRGPGGGSVGRLPPGVVEGSGWSGMGWSVGRLRPKSFCRAARGTGRSVGVTRVGTLKFRPLTLTLLRPDCERRSTHSPFRTRP